MSEIFKRENFFNNEKSLLHRNLIALISLFFVFDLIEARVKIIAPKELREMFEGKSLKASLSNFGNIPYGYNIMGRVYYNPDNLDDEMACKNITGIFIPPDHDVDESPIVMIDRGNCPFVTKVRNVENIGGHVALIINNQRGVDIENIIMSDDGHGKSLTIPGVLISKEDGQIIKTFYEKNKDKMLNKPIVLEIDFEMETSDGVVSFDVYFSSNDFSMIKNLIDMESYFASLKKLVKFQPRFVTFVHPQYNFTEMNDVKSKDCIAGGRYCATSKDPKITGKDIIIQNLKMKCAYDYDSRREKEEFNGDFLTYLSLFYYQCSDPSKSSYFSESCSAIALEETGYQIAQINECYANSFTPNGVQNIDLTYTRNKYLDKDNEDKKNNYLKMIPSVLINNRTFYGTFSPENFFEAICAGFKKKPQACFDHGFFVQSRTKSTLIIILIIVVVVILNVIVFILCRKYMNRRISDRIQSADINEKINSVVSNYLALRDQSTSR